MTKRQLQALGQAIALAALLVPTTLLAAQESTLPEASLEPAPTAQRDPYLAQAINNLPSYSFQQAGAAIAITSIKTIADAPVPQSEARPVGQPNPVAAQSLAPNGAVIVLEGEASYYSRAGCLGCDPQMIMANGQPLNDNALTMAIGAHLKHFVGHQAKVTSLATGKSVTVRITDTGGFYQAKYGHRVADLTIATKNAIGMAGGVGQVRVEVF